MKKVIISLLALSGMMMSGAALAEGSVARAIVTTAVADREPLNDLERVLAGNEKVLFYTELRGMEGQTIKHRWSYGGNVMAEVEFNVGGPRWRIWSSKNLMPEWGGDWSVEVVDAEGSVLASKVFEFAGSGQAAGEAEVSEAVGDTPVETEAKPAE